jgi:hypothetical protein
LLTPSLPSLANIIDYPTLFHQYLESGLASDPNDNILNFVKGKFLFNQSNYEDAIFLFEKAIGMHNNDIKESKNEKKRKKFRARGSY